MLPVECDGWLERKLNAIGERIRVPIGAVGAACDHVHVALRLPRDRALAEVVQRLKGATSHDWNVELSPHLLRWQPGYWAESVSPTEVPSLLDYVRNQRAHHRAPHPERWEECLEAPLECAIDGDPSGA